MTSAPDPASILAGLAHAVAGLHALAAQLLAPDWDDWTPDERSTAIGDAVGHLRALAQPLATLHPQAGALALEQALSLARLDQLADGAVSKALVVARAATILGRWLESLAAQAAQEAHNGPLTLAELFQRVQSLPGPRPRLAFENQAGRCALETGARALTRSANQLGEEALGLLALHDALGSETASDLCVTAETLFAQAGSVFICAAGLLSETPYGVAATEDTADDDDASPSLD